MGFDAVRRVIRNGKEYVFKQKALLVEKKEFLVEKKGILMERKHELFQKIGKFIARFKDTEDPVDFRLTQEHRAAVFQWAKKSAQHAFIVVRDSTQKALAFVQETVDILFEESDDEDAELEDFASKVRDAQGIRG